MERKIKILFLPYKLHFRYFLRALARKHSVTVLLPPEKSLPKNSELKGVRISYRQFGIDRVKRFIGRELRTQKYVNNFPNILRTEDPDVLITCEFYHWYTFQALHYKKKYPNKKLYVVSETKRWPKNFLACAIKYLIFIYFKRQAEHLDGMLVYTDQGRQFLAKYFPRMNVILAPAPIDNKLFSNKTQHVFYKDNVLRILFNARYSPYKRHKDLFQAVAQMLAQRYQVKVTCISRDDKRLDEVVSCARQAGVEEAVEFRRAMSVDDMPELYKEHDILVLPSYNEAIGMVVPEAMSCGRATVTSDTVGANVYVNPGITGYIFKTGDVDDLSNVLKKCCDRSLLKAMGDNARQHIISKFTDDQAIIDFESSIKEF